MTTEQKALEILRRNAPNTRVFEIMREHVQKVEEFALKIAKQIEGVDLQLIKSGSLLHDIGRFLYPPGVSDVYKHGVVGGMILRKENLSREAQIAERHVGAGITKKDIQKRKLQLPEKDFVPLTKEEKIICYADKRVEQNNIVPIEVIAKRFDQELGLEYGNKIRALHEEIQLMIKKSNKSESKKASDLIRRALLKRGGKRT